MLAPYNLSMSARIGVGVVGAAFVLGGLIAYVLDVRDTLRQRRAMRSDLGDNRPRRVSQQQSKRAAHKRGDG
jgi:hypothetical protein